MRNILVLFLILVFSFTITSSRNKEVSQVLFEVPIPVNKFDVRKLFHGSSNFSDIHDKTLSKRDVISAQFNRNLKFSYLGRQNTSNRMCFYFKPKQNNAYSVKIMLEYHSNEYGLLIKQFKELESFFTNSTYRIKKSKITSMNGGETTGEILTIFKGTKEIFHGTYYFFDASEYYDGVSNVVFKGYSVDLNFSLNNL
jgi:hypothetical protein